MVYVEIIREYNVRSGIVLMVPHIMLHILGAPSERQAKLLRRFSCAILTLTI
jgi:hypothetical protein